LQDKKDELLKEAISQAWKEHPSYGHKRLGMHLQINHKRIRRVMRKFGIKPPRRKVNHFCTRSIKHRKYPNLIKDLKIAYEHQVWCSDTSEFKFLGSKWYIVTIIDIFTRQVLGVAIGKHHNSELVMQAIEMAITVTHTAPLIFHSDQGTEFMAQLCTDFLEKLGTKISASDKASPWQNGYQESFFGKFKDEIGDINRFETAGELIEELYHHIYYYNTKRIHTALKMPPAVYANSLRNLSEKMGA
jgi:transposase InsO family protein